MLIENPYGIAVGDNEDPELIAFPREGIPEIIDTQSALEQAAEDLSASSLPVAVDVERAQGFRYGSSPYLLQLRREDVGSFLIDTAALPHLECLQASMNSTWILHDASQDLPNLRELGLEIPALFDTQVASRLLGMTHFGLSAVCEQVLGLTLVKDHQASNWSVRPLPKDWLRYAVLDVELLTALKDSLEERLDHLGPAGVFAHCRGRPAFAEKRSLAFDFRHWQVDLQTSSCNRTRALDRARCDCARNRPCSRTLGTKQWNYPRCSTSAKDSPQSSFDCRISFTSGTTLRAAFP